MHSNLLLAFGLTACGVVAPVWGGVPPSTPDPHKTISQYLHNVWRVEEGLPQNTVAVIHQTRDGYLWLGTSDGLARFDGLHFDVFDERTSLAFEEGDDIRALLEDEAGVLWVGTFHAGLIQIRGGVPARFEVPGFEGYDVLSLAQGTDGTVWVGTREAGLLGCSYEACRPLAVGAEPYQVQALATDAAGGVWAGTDRGLLHVRGEAVRWLDTEDGLPHDFVQAVHATADGAVWVGTKGGLARAEGGRITTYEPADGWPDEPVWALWEDEEGSLWMGLDQSGLARHVDGRLDRFTPEDGLSHGRVRSLHLDREGNLWVGTEAGGLNRLRDGLITTFTTANGLPTNDVLTVHEDEQERLWIGTADGNLSWLNVAADPARAEPLRSFEGVVTSVQGRGRELWVGTLGGLHRSGGGNWTSFTAADGLPSDRIYALHVGQASGDLWVGTDAGIGRYAGGRFTSITPADGLTSRFVTYLHEDASGALWVGTYDGGLNRVEGDAITVFREGDGLGSDGVWAIHEDADGTLWIGTFGGGLTRYRDGAFTRFTPRHGLYDDNIYQVFEDADGFLWMGSNRGIFRVAKVELEAVAEGRQARVTSFAFDTDNGMRSREVNGGVQPAGWQGRDGRLWFPTVGGLSVVDPSARQHNARPPDVHIEAVRVDDRPLGVRGRVVLPPGTDEIAFDYVGLSFVDPPAVRYRFKLEGLDDDWSSVTDERLAHFYNLDPGAYTFRVVAMNNDGVWNEAGASFAFRIQPFVWQMPLFWMFVGLGLVGLGWGGHRLRIRRLVARQRWLEQEVDARTHDLQTAKGQIEAQADSLRASLQEKEVLLRELHHRVKNNLQIISSLLHLQSRKVEDADVQALFRECQDRIQSMAVIHERLYRSDTLASIEMGDYLRSIAERLAHSYRVGGAVHVAVDADEGRLGVDQAIPCGLIVNELVSNALKYAFPTEALGSRTGTVRVGFHVASGEARLVVADDGVGLPEGFEMGRPTSLGLKLVHALAKKLQATVEVHAPVTSAGSDGVLITSGTAFTLSFPVAAPVEVET